MKGRIHLPITLLLVWTCAVAAAAAEPGPEERLFAANQAYRENHFEAAAQGYRKLLDEGLRSGDLYFNLGNACLKLGQLGVAVLNYERAHALVPRDPDLNFNLRFARDQLKDIYTEPAGLIQATFFWLSAFSLGELFWAFALVNGLFWAAIISRFLTKREWAYRLAMVLLFFWLATGVSFGLKCYQTATDNRGVILVPECEILAGPGAGDTVLFKLHEGALVHVERVEDDWTLIHLPDGKRGWIPPGSIEKIRR